MPSAMALAILCWPRLDARMRRRCDCGEPRFDEDGGAARAGQHRKGRLLHAVVAAGVHTRHRILYELRELRRLPQVFVDLKVAEDEAERTGSDGG